MPDMPITQKDLDILRKIIHSKHPLTVNFQEDTKPSFAYDLNSSECDYLVQKQWAEYFDMESDGSIPVWDLFVPIYIKGKIKATKLGEYVSETYQKDESRYERAMAFSKYALILSSISLLISLILHFLN